MSPEYFWTLTFFELDCLFQHKTNEDCFKWDRVRFNSTASLNSNPYLKKSINPTDLFSLPTDNTSVKSTKEPTKELFESEAEKVAKLFNRTKV